MKNLLTLACLFLITLSTNIYACNNPNCSYEKRNAKTGTIMHFDAFGNLIGHTKG